jgi:hypothetical protein
VANHQSQRLEQALTVFFGVLFVAVAAALIFGPFADGIGLFRWGIGVPLGLVGLVNLALASRFSRETLPDDADFQPLDAQGRPVVGSALVQRIAGVLSREVAATPHRVETSPDSVRVTYDSGVIHWPGSRSVQQFRWRTTLTPTSDPATFVRLDQEVDRRNGRWAEVRAAGGLRWGIAGRITVHTDGTVVKQSVSTSPVSTAVRVALQECGARQAIPTMALVGIANGSLGILFAVGAVVIPALS